MREHRSKVLAAAAVGAASLLGLTVLAGSASAAITGTQDANSLAQALGGPATGSQLEAPSSEGFDEEGGSTTIYPNGVSDGALSGFPTSGPAFTIMTTGDVSLADDPNESQSDGFGHGFTAQFGGEANDPSRLAIPVEVPQEMNCVGFDFKFFSEEFPEYVGSPFNDGFIAEIDQSTWSVSGQEIDAPNDFAGPLGQERISVNNVGPTEVTPEQAAGTTYDGATPAVKTKTAVSPGSHILYLSVFDAGDDIFDTAVFLDNLQVTNEDAKSCRPPDTFGGETGVVLKSGAKTVKATKKSASVALNCTAPVPCPGTVAVKVVGGKFKRLDSGATPLAKRKPKGKLGKASYEIPSGASQAVKLKLTKKGKKLLRQSKKLNAKVTVTNSTNGAKSTSKTTIKPKR